MLQRNPEATSALYNLAKLEISLGHASEAKALLESWLARYPAMTPRANSSRGQ